ncbi:MAG: hypothetical protein A2X36_14430 [Elusimicrobia bacterium GWA2_69_24]|nr:MAG: hypothetical protein A2X36_14430 [Elusimicrobia bacterium GWA2_69_24]HBL18411.1 hypothetical protein [Elusimicrobiota bacterium]
MNESDRLNALYDALDFLLSLREPGDAHLWPRLAEKLAAALGAEQAAYFSYDAVSRRLLLSYRLGEGQPGAAAPAAAAGSGLIGWVAKFHEPLLLPDAGRDPRFLDSVDRPPQAPAGAPLPLLVLPLFIGLEFVGVFQFSAPAGGAFDREDLRLAKAVAEQASHAIRRLQLENMVNRVTTYNASILENLSGGFLAVDLLGRIMICNPAARRILGIRGEVTDVPVEKALTEIPDLAGVLRTALSSQKTVKRAELPWQAGGDARLLGYSTLLIKDTQGAFAGAGITFQDITALKR